jgi:chemotaxis protein methyltransferase CheR
MITDEELDSILCAIKYRYNIDYTKLEKISLKKLLLRIMNLHGYDGIFDLWQGMLNDQTLIKKISSIFQ